MHVAGYLAAAERIADGDADSPDDGWLWAPTDLADENRARWIEESVRTLSHDAHHRPDVRFFRLPPGPLARSSWV